MTDKAAQLLNAMIEERDKPLRERYPQYSIGEYSYGGLRVMGWDDKTQLRIGKFCSFAYDVQVLLGGEHRLDWVTTFPFTALWPEVKHIEGHPKSRGDVVIGNDVWVGAGAMLLSGTNLGDGCVVASRAVVNGTFAPYSIIIGNPARRVSSRFGPSLVERLQALTWWDWPRERLLKALPFMLQSDVETFVSAAERGSL
jgi:chloramphenicol O-acetyltransferase type B